MFTCIMSHKGGNLNTALIELVYISRAIKLAIMVFNLTEGYYISNIPFNNGREIITTGNMYYRVIVY